MDFDDVFKSFMILIDFQRKPKRVDETSYWKATDFILWLLHLILLAFDVFPRISEDRKQSLRGFSFAIRLLSKIKVDENDFAVASAMIIALFSNFIELFVDKMQTYNFHSMHNLYDQVRYAGFLWNFSAFAFEPTNLF